VQPRAVAAAGRKLGENGAGVQHGARIATIASGQAVNSKDNEAVSLKLGVTDYTIAGSKSTPLKDGFDDYVCLRHASLIEARFDRQTTASSLQRRRIRLEWHSCHRRAENRR
jgi:hypothetical protein